MVTGDNTPRTKVMRLSGEMTECARTRRRERRTQQRQVAASVDSSSQDGRVQSVKSKTKKDTPVSPRKRANKHVRNIMTKSDGTVSTASISSTESPKPKRPQHEKKNTKSNQKKPQNGKTKKSKRPMKCNKKASKPTVVEIEELSDEQKQNYVAIDCEMVGVGENGRESALARVSIVNWHNDVIVDKYVKVDQPVTDYRTFVSGISPAHLESDDAISLHECRALVSSVIEGKVVVGHALKNDFDVLRLSHPWYLIRDTAKFEPFMKTADKSIKTYDPNNLVPKKLKDLAKDKLGMNIQQAGISHDSIEDSIAAIELYKKARRKWEKAIQWKMEKTRNIEESNLKIQSPLPVMAY